MSPVYKIVAKSRNHLLTRQAEYVITCNSWTFETGNFFKDYMACVIGKRYGKV